MKFIILLSLFLFSCFVQAHQERFIEHEKGNKQAQKWTDYSFSEAKNIKFLLENLERSETGKRLLAAARDKAKSYDEKLEDLISAGNGSLTDTTLIRRFSPEDPDTIYYASRAKVVVNHDVSFRDAILDLAHELTHFVYRSEFNPYQGNFNLKEFIQNTVEGVGGEVHAFVNECHVLYELFQQDSSSRNQCDKIKDQHSGKPSEELARKKFYQLGAYYTSFKSKLDRYELHESLPEISNEDASFISSAYGTPYPIAAYNEYVAVMQKACENDKNRIVMLKQEQNRAPASAVVASLETKHKQRCSSIPVYH